MLAYNTTCTLHVAGLSGSAWVTPGGCHTPRGARRRVHYFIIHCISVVCLKSLHRGFSFHQVVQTCLKFLFTLYVDRRHPESELETYHRYARDRELCEYQT
nr:MAG TPA: hypothetical protein [Caudoviricetes sp.]